MKLKKKFCRMIIAAVGASIILTTGAAGAVKSTWIKKNSHNISITGDNYSDLKFLDSALKGKSVVCLGENFHRVAEYSSMKTRLIKYLHEKQGFDVIAFEASMGDSQASYMGMDKFTSKQIMEKSLFPVWYSKETLGLFDYIKAQGKTNKPLYLAGYDMQPNSMEFSNMLFSVIKSIDPAYAKEYAEFDIKYYVDVYAVLNKYGEDSWKHSDELKQVQDKYTPIYDKLMKFIEDHRAEMVSRTSSYPYLYDMIKRVIGQRMDFVKMVMLNTKDSYEYRDRIMADNVEWLMKTMYPGKKIIIWAHNDHIAKNTSQITVKENGKWINSFTSMGEILNKKLGDSEYVVGLFMNRGKTCSIATLKPFTISPAPKGSLENIIIGSGYNNTFVDLSSFKVVDKNNLWMFEPVYASEDGMTAEVIVPDSMRFIPKQQFDGIILIDNIKEPNQNY